MEQKAIILILMVTLITLFSTFNQDSNPNINKLVPFYTEFKQWQQKYNREYPNFVQQFYRYRVFEKNLKIILDHNKINNRTFNMGINLFTGLTQQEFRAMYLGFIHFGVFARINEKIDFQEQLITGQVDWVSQGAVTPVKNQGQCGSCWAFSATGALQGLSKLSYGSLQSFSEQQLVDCSTSYGNLACNGGLMDNAFKYVKDKGIALEQEYPYKAYHQACRKNGGDFKISGFIDIQNCNDLYKALTQRPVSVGVDAGTWSKYSSGVLNYCGIDLNHGVLVVGATDQYWKVKNSWTTAWGEAGYIRLSRGNTCGICMVASYPTK